MIARGATGVEVAALQERLVSLGWVDVVPDGKFGVYTDCAVRRQQRAMDLRPDGIVGPATQAAMKAAKPMAVQIPAVRTRLRVTHRSQRDNAHAPSSTCNVTSYAMCLSMLGVADPPGKQLEDALYERIVSPAGEAYARKEFPWAVGKTALWTVHGMLVWAAGQYGIKAEFSTNRRWTGIEEQITRGRPVVLSSKFTASGHLVVLSGIADVNTYIVDDPWGDWNRGYRDQDGSDRVYTIEALEEINRPDGQLWAHFFPR